MSELENQRKITTNIINKKLTASEKQLLSVYKSSLTNIRSKLLALNERSDWTQTELLKYDRLNKLQQQILLEIKDLSSKVYQEIKTTNKDIYLEEYNRSSYAYTKEVGVFLDFDKINVEALKAVIEMPYPNIPLQDFIKKIGNDTYDKLKLILGSNLLTGEGMANASKQIKDLLGISYNKALRIARTEGLRARSKAQLETTKKAEDLGLKIKKRWLSTLDFHTRPDHQRLDRQYADKEGYFHVSGYKALAPRMFGVAAEDINCRCTYTEEVEGISEPILKRKDNITKELIDNTSYDEWYQKYRIPSKLNNVKEKIKQEVKVNNQNLKKEGLKLVSENASQSTNSIYRTYTKNGVFTKIRFSDHPSTVKLFEGNDIELDLKDRFNDSKVNLMVNDILDQKYNDAIKIKRTGITKNVLGFDSIKREGDIIETKKIDIKQITDNEIKNLYNQLSKEKRENIDISNFKNEYLKDKQKIIGKEYLDKFYKNQFQTLDAETRNAGYENYIKVQKNNKYSLFYDIKDNDIIYIKEKIFENRFLAKDFHKKYENVIFE